MKAKLIFQMSGGNETIEVLVDNWPNFIRKGEQFRTSACNLVEGIAEVTGIIWDSGVAVSCDVECHISPDLFNELLASAKLKSSSPSAVYSLPDKRWKQSWG